MLITRLKLKNWRNFQEVDVTLGPRGYLIGPNASGKSNLLDVFRFLRTVARSDGGGLQRAVKERGGVAKLRSLHARRDPEVRIEVELADMPGQSEPTWRYVLAFKSEGKGQPLVAAETVEHNGRILCNRPDKEDRSDPLRLSQTHLEQINNNSGFRSLVEHFAATTYLHLVPQLLKHSEEISGRILDNDPFGQGLLQRIAQSVSRTRTARLNRIQGALAVAVPQFSELEFEKDPETGSPHLRANFKHWRTHGSWQREDQFSDGTLRLIALLWTLQEGSGLLLLEEPELSLHDAIIDHIPLMIDRVLRRSKNNRQILISTHSDNLISVVGDPGAILLLQPGENGSTVRSPDAGETHAMAHGLNAAEVLLPKTRPSFIDQLGLFV